MAPQANTCGFTCLNRGLRTAPEKEEREQMAETRKNGKRVKKVEDCSGEIARSGRDMRILMVNVGWKGGYFMEISPLRGVSNCKAGVYSVFLGRCDRLWSDFMDGTRIYPEKSRRNAKPKEQRPVGAHRSY